MVTRDQPTRLDVLKGLFVFLKGRVEKRFLLELDGVTWALCHERTPFAELALATVVMDSIRYKDQSGLELSADSLFPALDVMRRKIFSGFHLGRETTQQIYRILSVDMTAHEDHAFSYTFLLCI